MSELPDPFCYLRTIPDNQLSDVEQVYLAYVQQIEADNARLQRDVQGLREALVEAEQSLDTIARRRGFEDHDDFVANVRPYAASRALVARAALAATGEKS